MTLRTWLIAEETAKVYAKSGYPPAMARAIELEKHSRNAAMSIRPLLRTTMRNSAMKRNLCLAGKVAAEKSESLHYSLRSSSPWTNIAPTRATAD